MRPSFASDAGNLTPAQHSARIWLYVVLFFALLAFFAPRGARGQDHPMPAADAASASKTTAETASRGAGPADLAAVERAFETVTARVAPSVVGIRAKRRCAAAPGGESAEQIVLVNGSGTIVRGDGLILTNEHVVQAADEIEVLFSDGDTTRATLLAGDPRSDLAVLRVARTGLPIAAFCEWSRVARGQWTLTLGNPYGLGGDGKLSVSVGVISNLDRRLPGLGESDDRLYADMIQITAPIVPGNSGGPLFNTRGELVGIVTAMHTRAADDQGIGFAIPMTPARRQIIDRLLSGESIDYGYIGVSTRAPTSEESAAAGLPAERGAAIASIETDSPASAAGANLRAGDVIAEFNGQPVANPAQLAERVGHARIGEHVSVIAYRGREHIQTTLTIEPRRVAHVAGLRSGAILWRGLRLANLSGDTGARMGVDAVAAGVIVIDVLPGSPAGRAQVRQGDVIERVADDAVDDLNAFRQRVRAENGTVRVLIRGRGELRISAN